MSTLARPKGTRPTWKIRAARSRLSVEDGALLFAAFLFGSVTLTYPFSRDQGLFSYVGREWLERGSIPYRDMFEQKTPLIFFLHGVLALLTGESMWSIRAAEIVAIFGIGWFASRLSFARGEQCARGTFGAVTLAVATFYWGYFSFEDSGNCEIWCVLFALAASAQARHVADAKRAAWIAGAFIGLAVLAKPPAIFFAPLPIIELMSRSSSAADRARAVLRFSFGGAIVLGITVAYFAAHHALDSLIDVVFRANVQHALQAGSNIRLNAMLFVYEISWFAPLSYVAFALLAFAFTYVILDRDRVMIARFFVVIVSLVLASTAIAVQRKGLQYYFELFLAPYALLVVHVYALGAKRGRARKFLPIAFALPSLAIVLFMVPADVWRTHAAHAARMIFRRDEDPLATFTSAASHIDLPNSARVGAWLREHSNESDTVAVRGYEPQVYAFAGRHYGGRFFWSTFLTDARRMYRREEWLAEDRRVFDEHPPRYVVAFEIAPLIESAGYFESLGYVRRATFEKFIVLEKSAP